MNILKILQNRKFKEILDHNLIERIFKADCYHYIKLCRSKLGSQYYPPLTYPLCKLRLLSELRRYANKVISCTDAAQAHEDALNNPYYICYTYRIEDDRYTIIFDREKFCQVCHYPIMIGDEAGQDILTYCECDCYPMEEQDYLRVGVH